MGQFSWISVDTEVPIYNDRPEGAQVVTMVYKDESGDIKRVTEVNYDGYGEFGGIDFYDAVAWMNNIKLVEDDESELRSLGIDFYFEEKKGEFPQLFLEEPPLDSEIDFTVRPQDDPNQGWSHQESDLDYDEFDTYYGEDDFDDYDDDDDYDEDEDDEDDEEDDD